MTKTGILFILSLLFICGCTKVKINRLVKEDWYLYDRNCIKEVTMYALKDSPRILKFTRDPQEKNAGWIDVTENGILYEKEYIWILDTEQKFNKGHIFIQKRTGEAFNRYRLDISEGTVHKSDAILALTLDNDPLTYIKGYGIGFLDTCSCTYKYKEGLDLNETHTLPNYVPPKPK